MNTSARSKPRWKTAMVFLAAALADIVVAEVWNVARSAVYHSTFEEMAGLRRDGGLTSFVSHLSPNRVMEIEYDENADGVPDAWAVFIRTGAGWLQGVWYAFDDNSDGDVDGVLVGLGPNRNDFYSIEDVDGDGVFDWRAISLSSRTSDKPIFTYRDIDFDGKLDRMWEHQWEEPHRGNLDRRILLDNAWVPFQPDTGIGKDGRRKKEPAGGARIGWVDLGDGSKKRVAFENGEWKVVEAEHDEAAP